MVGNGPGASSHLQPPGAAAAREAPHPPAHLHTHLPTPPHPPAQGDAAHPAPHPPAQQQSRHPLAPARCRTQRSTTCEAHRSNGSISSCGRQGCLVKARVFPKPQPFVHGRCVWPQSRCVKPWGAYAAHALLAAQAVHPRGKEHSQALPPMQPVVAAHAAACMQTSARPPIAHRASCSRHPPPPGRHMGARAMASSAYEIGVDQNHEAINAQRSS